MSLFKNIAMIGASGSLGAVLFDRLTASGKFNIKVLRRQGSGSTFPSGTDVVDVNFDSLDSIKAAFSSQDVVISAVGATALASQKTLIDAAVAAGVKRFIPSEFGSDLDNLKTRRLPVFVSKAEIQDYLIDKSKSTDLTYTFLYNSVFLEWGLQHNFLLKVSDYRPRIINGGDVLFSATSLASVGDALVGILSHPHETKNKAVRVEDIKLSQNKILSLAKQLAPDKPWKPEYVDLDDLTAASDAALARGDFSMDTFVPYLWRASMDPDYGGSFMVLDNELLNITGKTDEDIVEILRPLLT